MKRLTAFLRQYKVDVAYLAVVLLVVGALLGLMLNRFLTVVNHDSAIFCILAQSILKGNYLLVSEPHPQPYFTFPPMLALMLAGLMTLFGNTDIQAMQPVFKGFIDLLFVASLPLFYVWVRDMLGRPHAMILTALVGLNPVIFKYSSDILSDTPYWALQMAAIFCAWRFWNAAREGRGGRSAAVTELARSTDVDALQGKQAPRKGKNVFWFFATVAMIILCALTRQIGMALVLAFLLSLGLQRQWKHLLVAALLFALSVGGWQSSEHFYRSSHRSDIESLNQQGVQEVLDQSPIKLEYVKHFLVDRPVNKDESRFQTSPAILLGNARDRLLSYTQHSLDQLVTDVKVKVGGEKMIPSHTWPFFVAFWLLLIPGLLALWRAFPFAALYLGLYMGVLMVYPYISVRFILPTFPLIMLCVYWGLLGFKERLERLASPVARVTAAGLIPVFVAMALIAILPDTIRRVKDGFDLKVADVGPSLRPGNRAYYETLLWIRDHTPQDSLVISRKPPVTYFYSGRRSTAFTFTHDTKELFDYVTEKRTRYGSEFPHIYIFEDTAFGESKKFLTPMVEQFRTRLTLVYTDPATYDRVWELK